MNKKILQKVSFFLWIAVTILSVFNSTTTGMQVLPIGAFVILAYMHIWGKKDMKVWILVLSALMFLVNLITFSLADEVLWLLSLVVFAL